MKLNREDFKGIEEEFGYCTVFDIETEISYVYNMGNLKLDVEIFPFPTGELLACVRFIGHDLDLCKWNKHLQSPEEAVKWVIKTIRRLEYHAKELRDN